MAKFKVGDLVEGIIGTGTQLFVVGVQFTITEVNTGFYAAGGGVWYGGDPEGYGIWENNLKLVKSTDVGAKFKPTHKATLGDNILYGVLSGTGEDLLIDNAHYLYLDGDWNITEIFDASSKNVGYVTTEGEVMNFVKVGPNVWTEVLLSNEGYDLQNLSDQYVQGFID